MTSSPVSSIFIASEWYCSRVRIRCSPRAIINRLNSEVRAIIALPDVRQRLAELGEVQLGSTPEEMRDRIDREIKRWTRAVELKNIERQQQADKERMWVISRISGNF